MRLQQLYEARIIDRRSGIALMAYSFPSSSVVPGDLFGDEAKLAAISDPRAFHRLKDYEEVVQSIYWLLRHNGPMSGTRWRQAGSASSEWIEYASTITDAFLSQAIPFESSPLELQRLSRIIQDAIQVGFAAELTDPQIGIPLYIFSVGLAVIVLEFALGFGEGLRPKAAELAQALLDIPIRRLKSRQKSKKRNIPRKARRTKRT